MYGPINYWLQNIGIKPIWFLEEPSTAMVSLILANVWRSYPFAFVMIYGALQTVPAILYEAAEIDGANAWHKFWKITLPMISPIIFFNLIMDIINSFQVFTQAYIMTNGGPMNASLFYVLYLYRNAFQYFKMGYACALGWILFFIILGLTLLVFKSSPAWVYYETESRKR